MKRSSAWLACMVLAVTILCLFLAYMGFIQASDRYIKVIVPNSQIAPTAWKFTLDPPPPNWRSPNFNDLSWNVGNSGFGSIGTPGIFRISTIWKTKDIWLRRAFDLRSEDLSLPLMFEIFNDDDVAVYLNGVLAFERANFVIDYEKQEVSEAARAALHPGTNTIAVHCHQVTGGQGVDVGLVVFADRP